MTRFAFIAGLFVALVVDAQAQRPIQWISNTEQGLAQARRVELPVMFYVAGSSSNNQDDDIRQAQQATFRDPTVVAVAQERFVPVRLSLSTQTKELLEKLGGATNYGNYLIFATPDMQPLGSIIPSNITQPAALVQQMTQIFRQFRKQLFESKYKEKLESADTSANEQIKILKTINRYIITEADESVVKLLENADLKANVRKQVYDTLSNLSTKPCVEALFTAAQTDKLAAKALYGCQNVAAEYLLPKLKSENFDEFVAAYEAIVKIANLGKPKSKGFWNGTNQQLLNEEIDRVEKGAQRAANNWRQKYEALR